MTTLQKETIEFEKELFDKKYSSWYKKEAIPKRVVSSWYKEGNNPRKKCSMYAEEGD